MDSDLQLTTWQWRKIALYDSYIQVEHGYQMLPVGISLAY